MMPSSSCTPVSSSVGWPVNRRVSASIGPPTTLLPVLEILGEVHRRHATLAQFPLDAVAVLERRRESCDTHRVTAEKTSGCAAAARFRIAAVSSRMLPSTAR